LPKLLGKRDIHPAKIYKYLLNPDHPDGASKERFFRSFGFDFSKGDLLTYALDKHAEERDIAEEVLSSHGRKSIIRCEIEAPDGRNPCILAVWIQEEKAEEQTFVTAYPAKEDE